MAIETTLDRALHDASQGRLQEAIEAVVLKVDETEETYIYVTSSMN